MSDPLILVVDDEPQILRAVERTLLARDFRVATATDGRAAVGAVRDREPDLVVLDLNLPHVDGLTACREIRRFSSVPILVLSVRDAEQDKVAALDLGADDYLTKPFGAAELLARVRALLRRAAPEPSGTRFELDDIRIDLGARSVRRGQEQIHLTHDWLLAEVWDADGAPDVEALRVFVSQLRRKIEPDPRHPRAIVTESRIGYRWQVEPSG